MLNACCRRPAVAPAVMLLLGLLTACRGGDAPSEGLDESVLGVTVAAARIETLRDVASAPGTVVATAAGDWTIYAPAAGEIAELPKARGDSVETGDLLVRFEIASQTQALAAMQLAVLDAEAALERSASTLARQTDLFDRGLISRNAFDQARHEHAAAESALNQARSSFEAAQSNQDLTVIRARFPGTVAELWHAPGDPVAGGPTDPVMRVVDPSRIQVSVHLPLAQLARVVPGQTAVVRPLIGSEEPAAVAYTPAVTDPSAATGEVRLTLQNPVVLPLDSPVSVDILLDVRTGVLAVPTPAVQRDDLGAYVMVVPADEGRARRRDVRAGLVAGDLTQIVTGLVADEVVIVSGVTDDSEGLPVEIVQ